MFGTFTRLQRYYLMYTGSFLVFIFSLWVLERHGMPPRWIGYAFLFFTISMYAAIGIVSRTSDVSEYYVAGRRVPAFFNGMATGADWMSAASFMGLAGTLYLSGYQGLAYVIGWTGGFVLVALLLAPYLRRFGAYTIPDFLGSRTTERISHQIKHIRFAKRHEQLMRLITDAVERGTNHRR